MKPTSEENFQDLLRTLMPAQMSPASGKGAEEIMRKIVEPLLQRDGYSIHGIDTSSHPSVAFIFRKQSAVESKSFDEIAVEYKPLKEELAGFQAASSVRRVALSAGIPRSMLVTNARFTQQARELFRLTAPVEFQPIDIDGLHLLVKKHQQLIPPALDPVNIIRRETSQKLIAVLTKNPRLLDGLEWRELERVLYEVFEGLGFGVRLGRGSKDGGKDITLTCYLDSSMHTYYVEVKHWRSPVGIGPVRDFLNVIVKEEVDGGLFLSSRGLNRTAVEGLTEIRRSSRPLRIGSGAKINALCQSYVKMMSGMWIPERPPQELLFDETI